MTKDRLTEERRHDKDEERSKHDRRPAKERPGTVVSHGQKYNHVEELTS